MIGKLKIDKSSVELNLFLQSVLIVHENGDRISRYQFERQMDIYQHGKSDLPDLTDEESKDYVRKNIRTQYNKSKLPRYYGFIGRGTNTEYDKPDLLLTKRGSLLADYIEKTEVIENGEKVMKCSIKPENKLDFVKLIFESILYDSFGKNNCGMETSASDVEMPKVVLKTILLLGSACAAELLYIAYGMDEGFFKSFDEAINDVKQRRKQDEAAELAGDDTAPGMDFMTEKVREWGKFNFIQDCKFVSFFAHSDIGILDKRGKYYYLDSDIKRFYRNELQQLMPVYRPQQLIVSGVPGNGKSYYVEKAVLGNVCNADNVIRTIIHSDYTYGDFIGYVKPINQNGIKYVFTAGPLVMALERCLTNPNESIYLVVEEINRGDFASIMGDMFQLLDRKDDYTAEDHGWSMYPVENSDVYDYLKDELAKVGKDISGFFEVNKISFPSNLHLIGTMNTSDQNVFVLDTAFRRRFRNLYMRIDFAEAEREGSHLHKIDELSKDYIFQGSHSWSEFAQGVNRIIDEVNKESYIISEDKKLAPYFVKKADVMNIRTFCDKVIYYLNSDVFLYVEGVLDESYEMLYDRIITDGESPYDVIFGEE